MIRFDSISKQHGKQLPFVEASAAHHRGEKAGLVGPNGSGKSTLFRKVMREESPDEGQVSIDRGTTVGYISQDVGDMKAARSSRRRWTARGRCRRWAPSSTPSSTPWSTPSGPARDRGARRATRGRPGAPIRSPKRRAKPPRPFQTFGCDSRNS